jgi:hypothetical protein
MKTDGTAVIGLCDHKGAGTVRAGWSGEGNVRVHLRGEIAVAIKGWKGDRLHRILTL